MSCGPGGCGGKGGMASAVAPSETFLTCLKVLFAAILMSAAWSTICVWLHITPQMAAGYMGVSIGPPKALAANANRDEQMLNFGDFWIQDKMDRGQTAYANSVVNDKSTNQIEYPMGW